MITFWIFFAIFMVALLAGGKIFFFKIIPGLKIKKKGIYGYIKWKEKKLIHDYAMNPEKFMPKP